MLFHFYWNKKSDVNALNTQKWGIQKEKLQKRKTKDWRKAKEFHNEGKVKKDETG